MSKAVPLIHLENVTKQYPLADGQFYQALNGVTLSVHEGEFIAIMGPSGSGKSTTMHIIGALDSPSTGTYSLKGTDIGTYSKDQLAELRNKEIGFIFQAFNLLPRTTVIKNVERPMMYAGVNDQERRERALEALRLVGIADKAENLSNHISGGQIQRVAIARAIVMNPSIILADEPTGNLDTKTSHEIMQFFTKLNASGRTIVVITHEADVASYARRIVKIVDGKLVSDTKK